MFSSTTLDFTKSELNCLWCPVSANYIIRRCVVVVYDNLKYLINIMPSRKRSLQILHKIVINKIYLTILKPTCRDFSWARDKIFIDVVDAFWFAMSINLFYRPSFLGYLHLCIYIILLATLVNFVFKDIHNFIFMKPRLLVGKHNYKGHNAIGFSCPCIMHLDF